MWLTLAVTLITYLLSPRGTSEERRSALITAGLVGGGTYLATEYTDWGKDLSDGFDGLIGVDSKTPVAAVGTTTDASGSTRLPDGTLKPAVAGAVGAVNKTPATGSSIWESLGSWGPAAAGLVTGAVVSGSSSNLVPIAIAIVVGIAIFS